MYAQDKSSQSTDFVNSFTGTQPHIFTYTYVLSMAVFIRQQDRIVTTETITWYAKPKIYVLSSPLQKKFYHPLPKYK